MLKAIIGLIVGCWRWLTGSSEVVSLDSSEEVKFEQDCSKSRRTGEQVRKKRLRLIAYKSRRFNSLRRRNLVNHFGAVLFIICDN